MISNRHPDLVAIIADAFVGNENCLSWIKATISSSPHQWLNLPQETRGSVDVIVKDLKSFSKLIGQTTPIDRPEKIKTIASDLLNRPDQTENMHQLARSLIWAAQNRIEARRQHN